MVGGAVCCPPHPPSIGSPSSTKVLLFLPYAWNQDRAGSVTLVSFRYSLYNTLCAISRPGITMYLASLKRNVNRGIEVIKKEGIIAFARKATLFLFCQLIYVRLVRKPYRRSKSWLARCRNRLGDRLSDLYFAFSFVCGGAGQEYGITALKRLRLLMRIRANNRAIPSLTTWQQHIVLSKAILSLPQSLNGDVVECGAFDGASTVNLSLVCSLTGRRLFVCDSFEGLPEPEESERQTIVAGSKAYYYWQQGEYATQGGLKAVMETVSRFGNIEVCQFVKGYFKDTLKDLGIDSIVLVFEDADLPSSVRDCLIHLWPKLQEGCKFYSHEPWSTEVVGLFYDKRLWNLSLGSEPPGFWGSGHGPRAGSGYLQIGYAMKVDREAILEYGCRRITKGTRNYERQKAAEGERAD